MNAPLAAIDIGSNTIHLLVGKVRDGAVLPLTSERVQANLGAGLDRTGEIEPDRLRVALRSVELFALIAALHGAPEPAVIATSAVRDARNGTDLTGAIRALTGLDVRLLSGDEEARLGFLGAMSAVQLEPHTSVLVIDLGGGSVQLTRGEAGDGPEAEISLQLGTSRMTQRFISSDVPSLKELRKLRDAAAGGVPDWKLPADTVAFAVGGSARALRRLTTDTLTPERLDALAAEIGQQSYNAFARESGVPPMRARVLPAAATTLAALAEGLSLPALQVAQGGLREGVLLQMAGTG